MRRGEVASSAGSPLETALDAPQTHGLGNEVFEALPDPLLVVAGGHPGDPSSRRIIRVNSAARDRLKVSEASGLLVSAIRDPGLLEAVDEALFGGIERAIDYDALGAQSRHWRATIRPLPAGGDGPRALIALTDQTEVRRMERMRVDFLANASHELKTPLASLSGFIETLKGHARDDPKARDKFLDIMAIQTARMSRLVSDLLSLSRIELNEHVPPAGRVDLGGALSDVLDAVALMAQQRGIEIRTEQKPPNADIVGDRDEIIQVIQNLVDNGLKYSPAGGVLTVAIHHDLALDEVAAPWSGGARESGATRLPLVTPDRDPAVKYLALSVRDSGPGMTRETLPRLTERFFRAEGQKSGEREGTGLGLAIVKHVLLRHRGGLTVESEPERGSLFVAYFPTASRPSAGQSRS